MKRLYLLLIPVVMVSISCSKNSQNSAVIFYGKWKTSYGDTIVFEQANGVSMVNYNTTMNPLMPIRKTREFTYSDNKLGIKGLLGGTEFYFYQTFTWTQAGQDFKVQGSEWFQFVNSTTTYFSFTKIP